MPTWREKSGMKPLDDQPIAPQRLTTEPSDPTITGANTQASVPVSNPVVIEPPQDSKKAFLARVAHERDEMKKEMPKNRKQWEEVTRKQIPVVAPPSISRGWAFGLYIGGNLLKNLLVLIPSILLVLWALKNVIFYLTKWFAKKPTLIGDISWLGIISVALIISALISASYFLSNLSKFIVVIGPDEVGIPQYDGQFHYSLIGSEKSYECLPTGWYVTAWGHTVLKFSKMRKQFILSTHTMLLQDAAAIAGNALVENEEVRIARVDVKGSMVLRPDISDFRSVIVLEDITGGLEKASKIIDDAFARQTEQYLASAQGPHTMEQASAMDNIATEILIMRIQPDVIKAGAIIDSLQINIRPTAAVLTAIEASSKEKAEYEKDQQNMRSIVHGAIKAMGYTEINEESLTAYRALTALGDPNIPLIISARSNQTLGAESPVKVTKISTNSDGKGGIAETAAVIKEVLGGDKDGKE